MTARILMNAGFKNLIAASIREAQTMIRRSISKIVLLDWLLTGESGQFVDAMKELQRGMM
ncbi:MAG: hypothetical protein HQL96_16655 [Magnetococcales bacterium]|nr:hypothetical protein [Magnetococcales bacterium]